MLAVKPKHIVHRVGAVVATVAVVISSPMTHYAQRDFERVRSVPLKAKCPFTTFIADQPVSLMPRLTNESGFHDSDTRLSNPLRNGLLNQLERVITGVAREGFNKLKEC